MYGICITKENKNYYTPPLIMNQNPDSNIFIGQIIRDISFSMYIKNGDSIEITVVSYSSKSDYSNSNLNNDDPNKYYIFGRYKIIFNETNIKDISEHTTHTNGHYILFLDIHHYLKIIFSLYMEKDSVEYILTTPLLSGKKEYLHII